MQKEIIKIFDTTLRDGEQSPGASMNTEEKIQIAVQLERLGVDIIEAGFAAASPGDFEAISKISQRVEKSTICSLARAVDRDIKLAGEAVSQAKLKRIHTFIATSPIHMKYKLKMEPDEVIRRAVRAVEYAGEFVDDIEFSCEDAGRSDIGFLKEISDAVIEVGAKTINLPDTVGFRMPHEIGNMIREMKRAIGDRAIISVHNHNDLGLAVASSIEAIINGARQIECTINGLGERAGNASLEEIVMILKVRRDIFSNLTTNINTKEIYPTSRLISSITGIEPQPNKAIVGKNAFAHESGIHQDGMLKNRETYEIITPSDIGLDINDTLILGKHSGRAAFRTKLQKLGFELDSEALNSSFEKFKILADKKKNIYDDDLRAIVTNEMTKSTQIYELISLQVMNCSDGVASSTISIKRDNREIIDASIGEGTIDAIFKTIDRVSGFNGRLMDYRVTSVSQGKDALANVTVKVVFNDNEPAIIGHGLNSYLSMQGMLRKSGSSIETV